MEKEDNIKIISILKNCKMIAFCISSLKPGSPVNKTSPTENPSWVFFYISHDNGPVLHLCNFTQHQNLLWRHEHYVVNQKYQSDNFLRHSAEIQSWHYVAFLSKGTFLLHCTGDVSRPLLEMFLCSREHTQTPSLCPESCPESCDLPQTQHNKLKES